MIRASALFALFVIACGGGGAAPDGRVVDGAGQTTTIGPAGGVLSADGVTVTIPPGALVEEVALGIEVGVTPGTALPAGYTQITPAVRLTPHGQLFVMPVTIALPITGTVNGTPRTLYLADDSDTAWKVLGMATVSGSTLTVQATHFSVDVGADYVAPSACSPACTGGQVCVAGACVARITNPCGAATGYAPNSPWPTQNGCENNRRSTFAIGPATTPTFQWKWDPSSTVNQAATFGPVIDASGSLYMVSVFDVTKLSPAGSELWRVPITNLGNTAIQGQGPGVLLADGNLLVCAPFQSKTRLLNATTGALVWEAASGCGQNSFPPTPSPDGLSISNGNRVVDAATGALGPLFDNVLCDNSPIVDAAGVSYCASQGVAVAVRADGTRKWSSNLDGFHQAFGDASLVTYNSKPAMAITVYASNLTPNQWTSLYDLDGPGTTMNDPGVPHLNVTSPVARTVASNEDLILINRGTMTTAGLTRYSLTQVGQASAAATWTTTTAYAAGGNPPAMAVLDGNGDLYYGTFDGYLVSVSGATGALRWSVRVGQAEGVTRLATPAIATDGSIYIVGYKSTGTNAYLYAFKAP